MKRPHVARVTAALVAAATTLVAGGLLPTAAHASAGGHYYIEAGGTGAALPAPACTSTFNDANRHLNGGIAVPVCYPATAGPWVGGLTAPNYDLSANRGYYALLDAAENVHHQHPGARITIVGYSQGAQIADQVLQTIAGGTDIPSSQVDGMLYADPMQPGTGIWGHIVPKGVSLFGFTSLGAGPTNFAGIPVRRFCIHTDGICDATSIQAIPGYFTQHGTYPEPGGIITQTLAHDGTNGTTWYPAR